LQRQGPVLVCGLIVALAATLEFPAGIGQARSAATCKGYSYSGLQGGRAVTGVRATIEVMESPKVTDGHVAGWIGIGGTDLGPGGVAQWLQTGYSAWAPDYMQMYYELTLPGQATTYHMLKQQVAVGEVHTVALMETKSKGSWRVWLDGKPASPIYHLRGSHARYKPQGVGENWTTTKSCNSYDWLFTTVGVQLHRGWRWTTGRKPAYEWNDKGYKVTLMPPNSFETTSIDLLTGTLRPPSKRQ
jgi:hypothetical protein